MNDTEFWTRCLQSAFFYRDRLTNKIKDPIFDKAAQEEEEDLQSLPAKRARVSTNGGGIGIGGLDDLTKNEGWDEYGGLAKDVMMQGGKVPANMSIVRRLNRHGELVLQQAGEEEEEEEADEQQQPPRASTTSRSQSSLPKHVH